MALGRARRPRDLLALLAHWSSLIILALGAYLDDTPFRLPE